MVLSLNIRSRHSIKMRTSTININRATKRNGKQRQSQSQRLVARRNNFGKRTYTQAIASYCKVLGSHLPVYSAKKLSTQRYTCQLSLPVSPPCPTVKSQVHSEKYLARNDAAGQACRILIQNGEMDMLLRPSITLPIRRPLSPFGNSILTASEQDRLGLRSVPLSVLRVILTPRMDGIPGDCLPALGEAFLKFFLVAYFFALYQDETEGALTTRIQNESSKATLASYISTSGLARNICTGLYIPTFDDGVATTVFRDIIGAAIVFNGLDYALHVARSLGMAIYKATTGIQGIKVLYVINHTFDNTILPMSIADPRAIQRVQRVESALGYRFRDMLLVIEATTHNTVETTASYERLELLGDAVLEYLVAEYYYYKDPSAPINDFRKAKSRRLCNDALGTLCVHLDLHEAIAADEQDIRDDIANGVTKVHNHIANGMKGWKGMNLTKVLGDAFEALVGAVFVDAGFELGPVHEVLSRTLIPFADENDVEVAVV